MFCLIGTALCVASVLLMPRSWQEVKDRAGGPGDAPPVGLAMIGPLMCLGLSLVAAEAVVWVARQ